MPLNELLPKAVRLYPTIKKPMVCGELRLSYCTVCGKGLAAGQRLSGTLGIETEVTALRCCMKIPMNIWKSISPRPIWVLSWYLSTIGLSSRKNWPSILNDSQSRHV